MSPGESAEDDMASLAAKSSSNIRGGTVSSGEVVQLARPRDFAVLTFASHFSDALSRSTTDSMVALAASLVAISVALTASLVAISVTLTASLVAISVALTASVADIGNEISRTKASTTELVLTGGESEGVVEGGVARESVVGEGVVGEGCVGMEVVDAPAVAEDPTCVV